MTTVGEPTVGEPLSRAEILARSDLLIERRRLDQARALLAPALSASPDDEDLLHRVAIVEYLDDDEDAAAETVQRLLSRAPDHYGGRLLYAEILEHRHQHADAETVWLGLLRDFPESADLYASYARLMLSTLHLSKAQRLAAEALRLEPESENALFVMAMCDLIEGRQSEGSRYLDTLVREHPENVQTALALIIALQDRHDMAGALRVARELLRSQPTNETFVEIVRELQVENHWSMLPLYPMRRWGWAGSAGVWVAAIVGFQLAKGFMDDAMVTVVVSVWLLYIVYSWTWPAMLKRFI
jgi:tetratricopeptide (TPR) repeat protein